jgi:hypothetical protein
VDRDGVLGHLATSAAQPSPVGAVNPVAYEPEVGSGGRDPLGAGGVCGDPDSSRTLLRRSFFPAALTPAQSAIAGERK